MSSPSDFARDFGALIQKHIDRLGWTHEAVAIAVWGTSQNLGAFVAESRSDALFDLQFFLNDLTKPQQHDLRNHLKVLWNELHECCARV